MRSPTAVVFAHHFASIAGAGPIIGPILALAYGWGWAWLWIIIGGIFYGAVQDMTTMCVSLREGGKTIARELYDHESDPDETANVIGDDRYSEAVARLARQIRQTHP